MNRRLSTSLGKVLATALASGSTMFADTNTLTLIPLDAWSQNFVTLSVAGWGVVTPGSSGTISVYNLGQVVRAPEIQFFVPADSLGSTHGTLVLVPGAGGIQFEVDSGNRALVHTVSVACGEFHTLLLRRDGTVAATGWNAAGQASVPSDLTNVVAIACGADHSLALRGDGRIVAWGWDRDRQSRVPNNLSPARGIAGGGFHSLAVLRDGTVAAWGRDTESQCDVPEGFSGIVAVSAGALHSLALRADGRVVAWGDDSSGQCGVPEGLSDVVEISAGAYFSLARRADGTVVGWGDTAQGQSIPPPGLKDVVRIAGGEYHALALKANGTVVGWGDDTYHTVSIPAGMSNVVEIAAGGYHSEALVQTIPPLSRPRVENGKYRVELNLPAGRRYRLDSSRELIQWTTAATNTVVPGAMTLEPAPDSPGSGTGFFRATLLP